MIDPSGEFGIIGVVATIAVISLLISISGCSKKTSNKTYTPTRVGVWVPGGIYGGDTTLFQNIAKKNSNVAKPINTAQDLFDLLESEMKNGHSIKILTIAGHGWGPTRTGIARGPGIPGNQDPRLNGNNTGLYVDGHIKTGGGRTISDLKKLVDEAKIVFAKDALIQIHSCRISEQFIKSLASATGATVVAASSSCSPDGSDYRWKSAPGVWAERNGYSGFWRSKAGNSVEEIGAIYEQQ